ncbi:MAG TPA: apolipoprotein N-acyltransferase [Elusimicrobia bacterium]|nr:apolipoprotein N-acyltransferase [Elusimicrobiota bacterium]
MNKIKAPVRWLLAGLSGALLVLSFPPFALWPLAWVALCPLLLAALDCPNAKSAANLGGVTGLVFYGTSLNWMVKIFGPAAAAFWCIFALWIALHAALLWKIWNSKRTGVNTALKSFLFVAAAGVLWAGIEYFRCEVWWLECAWLAMGYSQTPALPILQTASLVGIYGLSALIISANAALCLLIKERRAVPALLLVLLLSILGLWGRHRTGTLPIEQIRKLSVALVQDESFNLESLAKFSLRPEAKNADLLIWPEYSFTVQPDQEDKYLALLSKSLKGSRAVKMIGAGVFPEDEKSKTRMRDYAWFISPEGKTLGFYDKLHPIPYVEKRFRSSNKNLIANHSPAYVATPAGNLGPQICYDLDFENGSRKMAEQGAQILVSNSLDPAVWGKWQHLQHSAMSPARAVESGLWLVRAASSGSSQIIDPLGKIRAALPPEGSGLLTGTAYLTAPGTFYSRYGWLFARLCLLAAMAAVLIYWRPFRK